MDNAISKYVVFYESKTTNYYSCHGIQTIKELLKTH